MRRRMPCGGGAFAWRFGRTALASGVLAAVMLLARPGLAQQPMPAAAGPELTLELALREARRANASLPISARGRDVARAQVREATARRWPRLLVDGDLHLGTPQDYATSDARLQLLGLDTLYDGGRLRTNIALARYRVTAAGAVFRLAEKDVEYAVRLRFSEARRATTEIVVRNAGLVRLRAYLTLIEARRAGGQGVSGDLLRTRTRIVGEEASIADAARALAEADLELNSLMGRPPGAALTLAALPAPEPPSVLLPDSLVSQSLLGDTVAQPDTGRAPWLSTPEVRAAEASLGVAQAGIALARAERRPTVALEANVGATPVLGDSAAPALLNTGRGFGAELVLSVTLPLWDAGIYRARLGQARFLRQVAQDSITVVRRAAHLEWARAVTRLQTIYAAMVLRRQNVALARDSYLQSESLYRGGGGSALDVIDAYASWIGAQLLEADATLAYRQAQAHLIRWGSP